MDGRNARDNNNKESCRLIGQNPPSASLKRNPAERRRQMCIASHISSHAELLCSFQLLPKAGRGERKKHLLCVNPFSSSYTCSHVCSFFFFFFFFPSKGQLAAAVSHFCHNQKGGDQCQVRRKALWLGAFQAGRLRPQTFSCEVARLLERREDKCGCTSPASFLVALL